MRWLLGTGAGIQETAKHVAISLLGHHIAAISTPSVVLGNVGIIVTQTHQDIRPQVVLVVGFRHWGSSVTENEI